MSTKLPECLIARHVFPVCDALSRVLSSRHKKSPTQRPPPTSRLLKTRASMSPCFQCTTLGTTTTGSARVSSAFSTSRSECPYPLIWFFEPCKLYSVKYIGPVSLAPFSGYGIINQKGVQAISGFEMCGLLSMRPRQVPYHKPTVSISPDRALVFGV